MRGVWRDMVACCPFLQGVTGVEDKLQEDIKPTLELLRNAGIKIWMLTGYERGTARFFSPRFTVLVGLDANQW